MNPWYRIVIFVPIMMLIWKTTEYETTKPENKTNITELTPLLVNIANLNAESKDKLLAELKQPLPFVNGTVDREELEESIKFLKLPTWSKSYQHCDSASSEVSCLEIVKAARAIKLWQDSAEQNSFDSSFIADVSNGLTWADKLSMLYQGLLIAITTNRMLITNRDAFFGIHLPSCITQIDRSQRRKHLQIDHLFACQKFFSDRKDFIIAEPMWPQGLYVSPEVGHRIRSLFSFHAAYFLGNWLFGVSKPSVECTLSKGVALEDVFTDTSASDAYARCGVDVRDADVVTAEDSMCGIYKMMSSERIIQRYGSGYGWWATAMQGRAGGFMNFRSPICVNTSNSQQASLWQVFLEPDVTNIRNTNAAMSICGTSVTDIQLYIQYLSW